LPTDEHQLLLKWLLFAFVAFVEPRGGVVQFAPLRLRLSNGRFREPDLLLVRDAADPRRQNEYWLGADLAVEIISPDDRDRDTVTKRAEYAATGVLEYWLVDPPAETVTVLILDEGAYRERGAFGRGSTATSAMLVGFGVDVSALFDSAARSALKAPPDN
jgi:Uma2 family endonuclease